MSAKASGANPQPNGNGAHNRDHNDGSSTRAFTSEQKEAVIRIRKCGSTAFYDILGLESEKTSVTDGGIKKAYRKLSLLTHPDKNGYTGADEAFKMVSRAFQILSDPDKKTKYDRFGGDPDSRFSSSASASSPFSGFARSPDGARPGGSMFEEEVTPEELFRQFFSGGVGGGFGGGPFGGGLFDSSPGFVFNLGGGPGVRVHQFGGNRPRRRPPGARGNNQDERPSAGAALANLLPLIIVFILPLLSAIFSGFSFSSPSKMPNFNLDVESPPYTQPHVSGRHGVTYYVDPSDTTLFPSQPLTMSKLAKKENQRLWRDLDSKAESLLYNQLDFGCAREQTERETLLREAQGWFTFDHEKANEARRLEMRSCKRLQRTFGMR